MGIPQEILQSAKQGKAYKGKNQLIKHLTSKKITRNEAIWAKCFDCNGMGASNECDMEHCSLFPYSPYRVKAVT